MPDGDGAGCNRLDMDGAQDEEMQLASGASHDGAHAHSVDASWQPRLAPPPVPAPHHVTSASQGGAMSPSRWGSPDHAAQIAADQEHHHQGALHGEEALPSASLLQNGLLMGSGGPGGAGHSSHSALAQALRPPPSLSIRVPGDGSAMHPDDGFGGAWQETSRGTAHDHVPHDTTASASASGSGSDSRSGSATSSRCPTEDSSSIVAGNAGSGVVLPMAVRSISGRSSPGVGVGMGVGSDLDEEGGAGLVGLAAGDGDGAADSGIQIVGGLSSDSDEAGFGPHSSHHERSGSSSGSPRRLLAPRASEHARQLSAPSDGGRSLASMSGRSLSKDSLSGDGGRGGGGGAGVGVRRTQHKAVMFRDSGGAQSPGAGSSISASSRASGRGSASGSVRGGTGRGGPGSVATSTVWSGSAGGRHRLKRSSKGGGSRRRAKAQSAARAQRAAKAWSRAGSDSARSSHGADASHGGASASSRSRDPSLVHTPRGYAEEDSIADDACLRVAGLAAGSSGSRGSQGVASPLRGVQGSTPRGGGAPGIRRSKGHAYG